VTTFGTGFIDRYEAAGLRKNPFTAPRQPAAGDFDVARLFVDRGIADPPPPGSRAFVQVIGASGMGKSSQLKKWREQTPGPFHYIARSPYTQRWATPPLADSTTSLIYGDEINRMPAALRACWFRLLARHDATLVIGTHVDLSSLAGRSGFDVITHHIAPLDANTFDRVVERRLEAYATHDAPRLQLDDNDLHDILNETGGVPGAAEVALHQLVAKCVRLEQSGTKT